MLLAVPILTMGVTALTLLILHLLGRKNRFTWLIAAAGALSTFIIVLLWQVGMPRAYTFFAWQPVSIFTQSPAWLIDELSWPLAIGISALTLAATLTSIARADLDLRGWAGSFALSAIGLAAVTAGNLLTLALVWALLDLVELAFHLRNSQDIKQNQAIIREFAARLGAIGILLWASVSAPPWIDFRDFPESSAFYLLVASLLRMIFLPMHLPFQQEAAMRRGFGSTLRLISAAASLTALIRLPASTVSLPLTILLGIFVAVAAAYSSWKWLRASDELTGRPYWVLGMALLAVASALLANPAGSAAWGAALLLSGGLLFLYNVRQRTLRWVVFAGILGLSSLPYTLTAVGWLNGIGAFSVLSIIFIPAQVLLIAGYVRHATHSGESNLESQPRLIQAIYIVGLLLLPVVIFLLGVYGWQGAAQLGQWWLTPFIILGSGTASIFALTSLHRLSDQIKGLHQPGNDSPFHWLARTNRNIYGFLDRVRCYVVNTLEGDGGIFWSLLLLALLISVLSSMK